MFPKTRSSFASFALLLVVTSDRSSKANHLISAVSRHKTPIGYQMAKELHYKF
jgi:hypothetical protein